MLVGNGSEIVSPHGEIKLSTLKVDYSLARRVQYGFLREIDLNSSPPIFISFAYFIVMSLAPFEVAGVGDQKHCSRATRAVEWN